MLFRCRVLAFANASATRPVGSPLCVNVKSASARFGGKFYAEAMTAPAFAAHYAELSRSLTASDWPSARSALDAMLTLRPSEPTLKFTQGSVLRNVARTSAEKSRTPGLLATAHAQYAGARKSWGINALGGLVVEIEADDGTTGVGVTIGGAAGAQIVERHLSRFVEGRDPRDVESIWDQMFRATLNYGRKGLAVHRVKLRFGLPHAIDATSSP